ncbi:proton channel OtopLc-like isoform X1 [Neodiprion virginianus]|uniref:proton channel OtopLc-like isoform X1 n=2 Tax=Neodiprion virginianus TaxID=2961670 RepID=UPI001EE72D42|nr:proton channel OtopLc-like isoform X1 [Neodiprion virginianus]
MINRGVYRPSEPEPDYEGFVAGRFCATPSDDTSVENFGDRSSEANLVNTEMDNLSMEPQRDPDETPKRNSPEPVFKQPYLRTASQYALPENVYKNSDDGRLNSPNVDQDPTRDAGKYNPAFHSEEDDTFGPTIPRVNSQSLRSNGGSDPRLNRRRLDSGQSGYRTPKRPASLHLDNASHRSITLDRISSQPNGSSNGSMVLQLVLPPGALRDMTQESGSPNFSSVTDIPNEYYTRPPSVVSYGIGSKGRGTEIHSLKSPGLSRDFNSSASLHSEAVSTPGHHPPPSSCDEKAQKFRTTVSVVLSCIYAVILIPLALVIYIADLLNENSWLASAFNLYLVLVGFVYLIYLFFDIRFYVSKGKKYFKATTNYDKEDDVNSVDLNMNNIPAPNHAFCFALGRHAGSIYLRVGATIFCFGHLIHSGLILFYEILFLTSEEFYACFSAVALTFDILYPTYSFFLLFFIYKYSNVIINHCKELARILIMHTIATSLCFWIWAIFRESTDSLSRHANAADAETEEDTSEVTALITEDGEASVALPLTSYQQRGAKDLIKFLNGSYFTNECHQTGLNTIYEWFSPYLYPFTIEYSILIVGVLYVIWDNIGNCKRGGGSSADGVPCPPLAGPSAGSNIIVHADCHHANRGLFAGLLVLVFSIVSIILFFVAFSDSQYIQVGKTINSVTELVLLSIMTVTALLAYHQIKQLDVNHHPVSLLDDILLFIAVPAFFLYALFSIVPAVQKQDWLKICTLIIGMIQIMIQTPLIIDGLRRCSNAKKLRSKRPGRELITFLIICNVALWIIETFEIKSTSKQDDRYDFYGLTLWTILKHMTIPLTMFYRFHSSVCLADIWKSAYVPGEFDHH